MNERDPRVDPMSGDAVRTLRSVYRVDPCKVRGLVFYELNRKKFQCTVEEWRRLAANGTVVRQAQGPK